MLEVSFVGRALPFPWGFLPSAIFINIFGFNRMSNKGLREIILKRPPANRDFWGVMGLRITRKSKHEIWI
jgi:hypothetical protein